MKPSKRSKKVLPEQKRSSTPCLTQRRNSLTRVKIKKSRKIHTEPLPSPNSSFTEDLIKQLHNSIIGPKSTSRNNSPAAKLKLSFYLKVEQKLWKMVKGVSDFCLFNQTRNEFWELIKSSKIWEAEECFKELKTKKSVRKAFIIQLCGIMLSIELYTIDDYISNLKNLMLFIHQNYIEVLYQIYTKVRLPATTLLKKLKDVINVRRMNTSTKKSITLVQNNEILLGLLKEVCKHFRSCGKQSALSISVFTILKTVNKLQYTTVRDAICQALSADELILVQPEAPFLPTCPLGTYTLVLDLDETLVHFVQTEEEGTVFIRPGCEEFLKSVSEWYEVVIFTAGLQDVIIK